MRISFDLNQWIVMILALKAAGKNFIDEQYMDIENPPSDLNESMIRSYDNIDKVVDDFVKSITDIVLVLQQHIKQQQQPVASSAMVPECQLIDIMNDKQDNKQDNKRLPK